MWVTEQGKIIMSDSSNDKRRFSRVDFNTSTTISSGNHHWQSHLVDISLKGALINLPDGWGGSIGDEYKVAVILKEDEVAINMTASVAHIQDSNIGFRCEHIDSNSITHLRRLMELNLGDAELVNRELSMLDHA